MDNIIRYNELREIFINFSYDGSISLDDYGVVVNRKQKKCPLFLVNETGNYKDNPYFRIKEKIYKPYIASLVYGKTLYISPKSKMPRDLVRNSNYKITYSKDKADYIVIPKPDNNNADYEPTIVVHDTSTNIVYMLHKYSYGCNDSALTIDLILNMLAKEIGQSDLSVFKHFERGNFERLSCWLIKDIEEYEDILKGNDPNKYILDCDLPLTPTNVVSVETLDLWRRLAQSDENLLEKSVINSDAAKYPFTIYNFFNFDKELRYRYYGSQLRWYLKNIDITETWDPDRAIQPEDLALIQDYIFNLLGVDGNCGYVQPNKFQDLPYEFQNLIRSRLAVSKMPIERPMSYSETVKAENN